jgi:biofilm protein TabA
MIFDQINNSHLYSALNPQIERAFDYIRQADLSTLGVGKHEIDGANLYVMAQQYNTKMRAQGVWEAHRRYIDLHYLFQGAERLGFANVDKLTQGEYDPTKDFLPLFGEGDFVTMKDGDFVILMPGEAHMPGIAIDSPLPVKKVVMKIFVA